MNRTIFLYSGEGTHSSDTRIKLIKYATCYDSIKEILRVKLNLDLETLWEREIVLHRCPYSPLLTVVFQLCLSNIWRQWGYRPDVVAGHSTGELAAAYEAGFYSLEDVLLLAYRIGEVAGRLEGVMLHGGLTEAQIADLKINISSFNFDVPGGRHVTLSGYADEMDAFLKEHPEFVKMKLPHPWHHPDYRQFFDQFESIASNKTDQEIFLSGVTTRFETRLPKNYWHQWLVTPIDFIQTMQTLKKRYGDDHLDIIEIGFHPVLEKSCAIFKDSGYASSMFRGENDIEWILFQRKKIDQGVFLEELKKRINEFKPGLDWDISLAYQGLGSLEFTRLAIILQPYFPSLTPQDFYRYKTIHQLIDRFGVAQSIGEKNGGDFPKNEVVIAAMSCRFPSSVETPAQFWETLMSKKDQVKLAAGRGEAEAGYLHDSVTRFDHQYFNIASTEARTMDPQQILALELTEMLWKDAGIDPETLNKRRVGVYIGAWNQEFHGDKTSVFYPMGTNPSMIASRISYHYDLRGPSWVSNTACSSSLLAVHYAVKDIEAGRVDYAVAGGVNMLLDDDYTASMRNSGFLSRDNRCKAFDNGANGYVRAEGGGMVLLVNKTLADTYYAEIAGSAINQNGRRSQVITAPHPEAQEEVILAACQDAGIQPQEIAYIECHGTGTKIGDPIEISAIQNTIARDRKDICHIGSVKSNMGHLESAAGIAGLIKSAAILSRGMIPPDLHFDHPNEYIDFESYHLQVVTDTVRINPLAHIGVSSFGFGGSNAHIVLKGADAGVRKEIRPVEIPFDRERASTLIGYLHRLRDTDRPESVTETPAVENKTDNAKNAVTKENIQALINEFIYGLTGIEQIDPDAAIMEQGLDSLKGTELISQLEKTYKIEIEPDVLFEYPLMDQFVDKLFELLNGATAND